jgi:hypothetical protein
MGQFISELWVICFLVVFLFFQWCAYFLSKQAETLKLPNLLYPKDSLKDCLLEK